MSSFKKLDNNLKPREKIKHSEIEKISDAELLAILIGSGTKENDVISVAHNLLLSCEGLSGMLSCSIDDFQKVHGIGEVKAISLYTIFEISKRANSEKVLVDRKMLTKPKHVYELCKHMAQYTQEKVAVVCLNVRMELICVNEVFVGELSSVLIQPREIFKTVFMKNAHAFILIHNHPSGCTIPSAADVEASEELSSAANLLGVVFIDHIIIAKDGYCSIREEYPQAFS